MFVPESAVNSEIVAKDTRSTRGNGLNVGTRLTALCTTLALDAGPLPRRHRGNTSSPLLPLFIGF